MSYARSSHAVAVPFTLANSHEPAVPWCAIITAASRAKGVELARMYAHTGDEALWHAQFSSRPERLDPELRDACDRYYIARDHRRGGETVYRHMHILSDLAEYFPLYVDARKYAALHSKSRSNVVLYTNDLLPEALPKETDDATVEIDGKEIRFVAVAHLGRMSFVNSAKLPKFVNDDGARKHWVGIGWNDHGPAKGTPDEAIVCHSGYEVTACVEEKRLPLRLRPARAKAGREVRP